MTTPRYLAWASHTFAQNNNRPRLDEVSTKTSQLILISRLGETFSPERDPSSLKPPNSLAWAENRAQSYLNSLPSRLGEPPSPKRWYHSLNTKNSSPRRATRPLNQKRRSIILA